MAKEVFKTQLESLEQISKKLDNISKKIDNGLNKPMQKFRGTILSIAVATRGLQSTFSKIFGIIKNIGLTTLFGGGIIGFKGLQAQKQVTESGRLGISTQERSALEYAGKQTQADSGFLKDILKSINTALINFPESAEHFARLGLTREDLQGKSAFEQIEKVLSQAQKSNLEGFLVNESLQNLTGIDLNTLKSLDLGKLSAFYQEGLSYTSDSADQISKIGEGVNRVTTTLNTLFDKLLASFSPAIESIFNNIAKSLNAIANNSKFQELLEKLTQWAIDFSENFDTKALNFINKIPDILETMQIVFNRIVEWLAYFASKVTFGSTSESLSRVSQQAEKRADELERARDERELIANNITNIQKNPVFNPNMSATINLTINNDDYIQKKVFNQNLQFSGNLGGY